LGLLLFGGVFLAVGIGVAFTLVRLRLRDRKNASPAFISISATKPSETISTDYTD
jgi:hypothetical protein